jgi:hypothetical protein
MVQAGLSKKRDLISKITSANWALVVHICNPSYSGGRDQEDPVLKILSQKYPTQKRTGRVAQVVEHLPSKCEVLSSNPVPPKK